MRLDDLGATIGTDSDILIARSSDAGVTWTAPVALNANAASDGSASEPISLENDCPAYFGP